MRKQTEADVRSLTGLAGIREKPSMYAGSSDSEGMWTAVRELLDNELDEAFAGRNKEIYLVRDNTKPNAFWALDAGGGIPVGDITIDDPISHKKVKISALKAIVSLMHSGGKFGTDQQADGQRGTHGAGAKLTNAVSDEFHVHTCRDGKWY
jgi:DNA gyrase subunit B